MAQKLLDFDQPWRYIPLSNIFDSLTGDILSRASEDMRLERKSTGVSREQIADYICMWANTGPDGGIIVIGVDDKTGEITGCKSAPPERINRLEKAGYELCPQAVCEIKQVPVVNKKGENDFVVAIRVRYNEKRVVTTASGDAYIRRGDSKTRMTHDEIRIFEADKGQLEVEREPCRAAYPQEFDIKAIDDFVSVVCERKEWPNDRPREEVLELLHLGRKEEDGRFIPNVGCLLLFGSDPRSHIHGCRIRFLRIQGVSEKTGEQINKTKEIFVDGNIPTIIRGAEEVLKSQLREFERLGTDGRFTISPEYPKLAWYEAIVNAVAHRSYLLANMPIFVRMFDDRLEIESPGGFMPLVTPENIYQMHNPRNPHTMEAMYFLRYVRCRHEGTQRMRDLMAENELPAPEFAQQEIGFAAVKVTLRNSINHREVWRDTDIAMVNVGRDVWEKLSLQERRILNCVAENGRINTTAAAQLARVRWQNADKLLKGLVEAGILVRKARFSRDSKAHYEFPERVPTETIGE